MEMMFWGWVFVILLFLFVATFVAVMLIAFMVPQFRYWHVPGPVGWPLLGTLLDIRDKTLHGYHMECMGRHGALFKIWYGSVPHIVVCDPESAKKVLNRCNHRFAYPVPLTGDSWSLANEGLLFAHKQDLWKQLRRAWTPAFQPASLEGYFAIMQEWSAKLLACMNEVENGSLLDIWDLMGSYTLAIMGTAGFGISLDTLTREKAKDANGVLADSVINSARQISAASRPSPTSLWVVLYILFQPMGLAIKWLAQAFPDRMWRLLLEAMAQIKAVAGRLIDDHRAQLSSDDSSPIHDATRPGLLPGSFLKHLLLVTNKMTGDKLTDIQLMAQVQDFLLAGYETSASAITYTIYCLACNPDTQQKVLEEVDHLPRNRPPLLHELMSQLPYTTAAVHEALRLYPPVSSVFRESTEELCLQGVKLPKGTHFQVGIYALHHRPEVWREPLAFRPERFLAGHPDCVGTNFGGYLPFGGGQRVCVGAKLAMQEVMLTLAVMYQHYFFERIPGDGPLKVVTGVSMTPQGPVQLILRRRK